MTKMEHPIDNVQWLPVEKLNANSYNPNHVYGNELKLLENSILSTGWIQPILVAEVDGGYEIIDGFHRVHLTKTSSRIFDMTNGEVPCTVLSISKAERIMLTIRINRAKGAHIALRT